MSSGEKFLSARPNLDRPGSDLSSAQADSSLICLREVKFSFQPSGRTQVVRSTVQRDKWVCGPLIEPAMYLSFGFFLFLYISSAVLALQFLLPWEGP